MRQIVFNNIIMTVSNPRPWFGGERSETRPKITFGTSHD